MRDGRGVVAWVQLFRKDVEGVGVPAKVGDVEDGFGVGEVQTSEVGVQASVGRTEVGNCT